MTRAGATDVVDLAGLASAQTGVQASSVPKINIAGTSWSLVSVGTDSLGDFTIASAGETQAAVIGQTAHSLPLAGDAAANVRLTADAVSGTLDLGLTVAAAGDVHAVEPGVISLAGSVRSNITASAQSDKRLCRDALRRSRARAFCLKLRAAASFQPA